MAETKNTMWQDLVLSIKAVYWGAIYLSVCVPTIFIFTSVTDTLRKQVVPSPTGNPWDINGDGYFTISDLHWWITHFTAYPAHDGMITMLPRVARFFEVEKMHPTGFWQSVFGIAVYAWCCWLFGYLIWTAWAFVTQKFPTGWRVPKPAWDQMNKGPIERAIEP